MPFDISRFNAEATGYGFTRPALFLATIPQPPKWYANRDLRFLSYLCSSGSLPGTQIITSEERQIGYGPSRKIPYDVAHGDITLTFYSDGDGKVLAFFDQWLRNVVAFGNPSKQDPISGASWGEVQYPDNYEAQLQIYQYNENPGPSEDSAVEILKYTLDKAYPVSVSEVTLDWANAEAIQTVSVTFTYKTFWLEKNRALKYGERGAAVSRDSGYLGSARGFGLFDNENEFAKYAFEFAQSTNPGFIGIPFVDQLVGMVSSVYGTITDKLNVVNGYAAKINGQLNSLGALASLGRSSSKPLKVPQIPTIRFP